MVYNDYSSSSSKGKIQYMHINDFTSQYETITMAILFDITLMSKHECKDDNSSIGTCTICRYYYLQKQSEKNLHQLVLNCRKFNYFRNMIEDPSIANKAKLDNYLESCIRFSVRIISI